ncbi:hypothetical protein JK358_16375 [Nocardia sp. 2]|uniref:Uncharacterized protein n=1 Tax=Nocardia acididurans TaxID=2802282 RepID=A0ABS1M7H4_9NOCA|nr:DUF6401 family natural product biosynthesis protein [Nocardia acididurans]MBL1075975.1 hypothetical protein [Nocardia acididurans]
MFGSALLVVSARKTLTRLNRTHGAPARLAAEEFPALSAEIDQHAAAVRDILDAGVRNSAMVPTSVLLAGYARGVLEDLHDLDIPLPAEPDDWRYADWIHLRLAAVCALARTE